MAISSGQSNGHGDEPAAGAPAPAAEYTIQTFKPLLSKLLQRPSEYTPADLRAALEHLASGHISHAQTGSFLAGLKVTEVWRRPDLVEIIVRFMNHLSGKVKVGAKGHVCDLTWTGESALSVINVALPAGIIAAGAGCRVVKHGNASSPWPSTPSSGDILTALSVPTTTLPPFSLTKVAQSRHVPFLHIFTPRYSPRLTAISPLRRELGFETIFHTFSSLISPCKRDFLVIGVHEERLGQVFAEALKTLGATRAWVVHCEANGLDAISPEGETTVWVLDTTASEAAGDAQITRRTISPEVFGCPSHPLASVQLPNSAASNYAVHAAIIASLLSPRRLRSSPPAPITTPYEPDAYGTTQAIDTAAVEDFVCLNAAALIFVAGRAPDEKSAFELARRSLRDGKAYHALEALRDAAALSVDTDDRQLEGSDNE